MLYHFIHRVLANGAADEQNEQSVEGAERQEVKSDVVKSSLDAAEVKSDHGHKHKEDAAECFEQKKKEPLNNTSPSTSSDPKSRDAEAFSKQSQSKRRNKRSITEKAKSKSAKAAAESSPNDSNTHKDKTKKEQKKLKDKSKSDSGDGGVSSGDDEIEANQIKPANPMVVVQIKRASDDPLAIQAVDKVAELLLTLGETKEKPVEKKGSKPEYFHVDRVWSEDDRCFVVKPSTDDKSAGQYEEYAFNVVRRFDYRKRYERTELVILSKSLKTALLHVMSKVKGIFLEEDKPAVDPNMVFLHLDQLRVYTQKLQRRSKDQILDANHLDVFVKYFDQEYNEIKKSLRPLLESGKINFDLVWALFKSNDIVYTSTYDIEEQPRALRIEYVTKVSRCSARNIHRIY